MTEYAVNRDPKRAPVHPGEILREDVMPALGMTIADIAKEMDVPRQTLHQLLAAATSVTPEVALGLGKLCGNGPGIWLRMQEPYDLWHNKPK